MALDASPGTRRRRSELATRLASAAVLAAVALGAVLASPWTFALLVVVAGVIVAWEWGKLVRGTSFDAITIVQALTVMAIAVLGTLHHHILVALAILAGAAVAGLLSRATTNLVWSIGGVAYSALPAWALIWLRSDENFGAVTMLYLLAVAWTTDSASFLAGRSLGGPKLAPKISPKKTWSGLIVGMLAPAVVGLAFAAWLTNTSALMLAFVSIVVAAACQLGDFCESAIKRRFGAKDASNLIPGHGGLLDRIDGLVASAVVAALIALRDPSSPGRGLLQW